MLYLYSYDTGRYDIEDNLGCRYTMPIYRTRGEAKKALGILLKSREASTGRVIKIRVYHDSTKYAYLNNKVSPSRKLTKKEMEKEALSELLSNFDFET